MNEREKDEAEREFTDSQVKKDATQSSMARMQSFPINSPEVGSSYLAPAVCTTSIHLSSPLLAMGSNTSSQCLFPFQSGFDLSGWIGWPSLENVIAHFVLANASG